ncbi:MAG TPA: hypothetical protein VNZ52_02735, partial [Candidatus Thermoplasmatota archaeon]|nr:hypothetical protein [Candidatus Thermoplasmatota archaeon]
MTRGLNPFHLLLAGLLLLVLDARRNGLDLFPNLLGFGLLVGAAFLLQESTAGPGERRLLQG